MLRKQTRRAFVQRLGGLVVGLSFVPLAGCEDNLVEPLVDGADVSFLTPTPAFYVQYGGEALSAAWGGVQQISRADWRLQIEGLVATPQSLTFADLEAEAALKVLKTMRCITDDATVPGLVGNALWTGVPLRTFLDRAGIDRQSTRRLHLYGADGFTNNLPIERLYGEQAAGLFEPLLVFEMNGAPLTAAHGAPVRLIVQEQYGYKNVKWLERIVATAADAPFGTYQEVLGYVDDGIIRVVSKVTNPLRNAVLSVGPFAISGYALSGFGGIARVEMSIDGAPFEAVRLRTLDEITASNPEVREALQLQAPDRFAYPYRGVWALWSSDWDATPGMHTIRVRATDEAGHTQPERDLDPTDGHHPLFEIAVEVA